jgi:hypothetical protein
LDAVPLVNSRTAGSVSSTTAASTGMAEHEAAMNCSVDITGALPSTTGT